MKTHYRQFLSLLVLAFLLAPALVSGAPATQPATRPATRPTSQPAVDQARQNRQRLMQLTRNAINLLQSGKPAEAETALTEALAIDPTEAINLYNMACAKALLHRPDAAIDYLERAALEGFTDFVHIAGDTDLNSLRDLPRFKQFLTRKNEFQRRSAGLVLDFLKKELGAHYLYELDETHKLIFASDTDKETLASLKSWLTRQATSQWAQIFEHKPDNYIVVLLPNPADYRKMVPMPGVGGLYSPERRTLICQKMGQVVTHEFTHALHAADIEPLAQEHPIWLMEGLASMFEAGRFEGDTLVPTDNFRLEFLQRAARTRRLIALKRLTEMDQPAFIRNATMAYGQASSLLLYLYDKKQLKPFYDAYKKNWETDKNGQKTLEKVLGKPLAEIEADWKAWMLARKAPVMFTGEQGVVIGAGFAEQNDGLRVQTLAPRGPAARAGVLLGDVIVGLGEDEVRDQQSLVPLLARHKAGDAVALRIRREHEYLTIPVTLAKRSDLGAPLTRPATRPTTMPVARATVLPATRPAPRGQL
ncbi:MAG: PDZ domain-containing protein [Tepidisphaerales bacterium]